MKLPSMQFYPGDWWKDPGVSALSCEERGIWFQMILLMFESEERGRLVLNGKPMPEEALARVIGLETPRLRGGLTHILEYGVASIDEHGVIFSRRMLRDEEKRIQDAKHGKKGGNPTLIAKRDNPIANPPVNPPVKPNLTPSSSSSSSSSEDSIVPTSGTTPTPRKRFIPPTPEEVRVYGKEIGFDIDAEKFCDFYAAKGWVVGKSPMKDWKAAVRTWRSGQHSTPVNGARQQQSSLPDFDDLMNDPYHGGPGR